MEYERIYKVQTAVISPSKLRMKLLGPSNSHNLIRKKGGNKSCTSSPKLEELDFSKSSLLAHDFHEQEQNSNNSKEASRREENTSHGSESRRENGSPNFEFQREETPVQHLMPGPFFRQVPSKWNDAEKWIANRHLVHSNPIFSKKGALMQKSQNQGANSVISNDNNVRAVPELKISGGAKLRGYKKGMPRKKISFSERNTDEPSVSVPAQSVSMRDIGTEMTPIGSQEQSMAGTPRNARSPSFSPLSSIPSTPKRGPPSSGSSEGTVDSRLWVQKKVRVELETPEQEMQIRTRREIAALGLKLGKFNIASWASKDDEFSEGARRDKSKHEGLSVKKVFEARAAVWEESQKSKLVARYKSEEVKIQAWEISQQSKFEAQMNQVEARAEQMKAQAQQNAIKKISNIRRKAEGKQAKLEERRTRRAARLAKEVDQIFRTGRAPTSCLRCCSWFSFGLLTK
ncbi:hypothetical protein LUZ60_005127 [Juncus effusus]|nr:hypothetical protein LUZ60_005127 [Juncus effusus]